MVVRGRRPQYRCGEVVDGGLRGEGMVANGRRRKYQGAVPVVVTAATVCARAALRRRRPPANTAPNFFGGEFSGAIDVEGDADDEAGGRGKEEQRSSHCRKVDGLQC